MSSVCDILYYCLCYCLCLCMHGVLQAANAFMMIIECSQAKLLYVSDTIEEVLDEEPKNWIGSCLYDLLHPKVRGGSLSLAHTSTAHAE